MRKILGLATFILLFAWQAKAQTYPYLVFTQLDGTEQSIGVDGLKITFPNGTLCATQGSQTITLPLATLSGMHFALTATGVSLQTATASVAKVSVTSRQLSVSSPVEAQVRVYNAAGLCLASATLSAGESCVLASALQPGVYAVVINGNTQKICVR